MDLIALSAQCPYCWQTIDILIDPSVTTQDYIEDCSVCCQPIRFKVEIGHDKQVQIELLSQED